MNKVYELIYFKKRIKSISVLEKLFIEKSKTQISRNLKTGKPLGYYWLREKKFGNKRLIFIINVEKRSALLIFYVNKKDQQNSINFIVSNKDNYFKYLK